MKFLKVTVNSHYLMIYNLQLFLLTLHMLHMYNTGWKNQNIAKEKRESDFQKIIKSSQTKDRIEKNMLEELS